MSHAAVTQTTIRGPANEQRPRGGRLMPAPHIPNLFADWPLARGDGSAPRAAPDARAYHARESLDGGPIRLTAAGGGRPAPS